MVEERDGGGGGRHADVHHLLPALAEGVCVCVSCDRHVIVM